MVWIQVNEAGVRDLLNNPKMQNYLRQQGWKAQAKFVATTKRSHLPKPHNADSSVVEVETYKGLKRDRAAMTLSARMPYSTQREVGGTKNAFPEATLMKAIGSATGRVNQLRTDTTYLRGKMVDRPSYRDELTEGFKQQHRERKTYQEKAAADAARNRNHNDTEVYGKMASGKRKQKGK